MLELLGLFATVYAVMVIGGLMNRASRERFGVDIARWLGALALGALALVLAVLLWRPFGQASFRAAFILTMTFALLATLALGAAASRPEPDGSGSVFRTGAATIAAFAIVFVAVAIAFIAMWGDLHAGPSYPGS
jgi:hypothetical protein